jgi:uncharacterized RDD family membrane protein YckC
MNYASIFRRFGAMVLDGLIIIIPAWVMAHAIPLLGGVLVLLAYYPLFESSRLRATIGKHLMGIEVTGLSGERLTFRAACLRLLLKLLSMACMFIGHFFAFFTERHQAFHDLIAESVVVYGREEISVADAWVEQLRAVFGVGKD